MHAYHIINSTLFRPAMFAAIRTRLTNSVALGSAGRSQSRPSSSTATQAGQHDQLRMIILGAPVSLPPRTSIWRGESCREVELIVDCDYPTLPPHYSGRTDRTPSPTNQSNPPSSQGAGKGTQGDRLLARKSISMCHQLVWILLTPFVPPRRLSGSAQRRRRRPPPFSSARAD